MPEIITSKTLATYVFLRVRKALASGGISRAFRYAGKVFFVARIFRYFRIALTVIETSAALLILAAVLVALIPLVLISLLTFALADFFIGRRLLRSTAISDALLRPRVYIISAAGAFGKNFAAQLAKQGAAVFVISADIKSRFLCAKNENGVFYIRHAFYFRLRRGRLEGIPDKTVYLL